MRKDLHVGLAIGGVLLAVLIVWGVVVNHGKHNKNVTLETSATNNGGGSEIPPAPPVTPAGGNETSTPAPGSNTDVAPPGSVAATNTGGGTPPAAPASPTADSSKETDWRTLLATGGPVPAIPDTAGPATPAAGTGGVTIAEPLKPDIKPEHTETPLPNTPKPVMETASGNDTAHSGASATSADPSSPHSEAGARTHKVQQGETFASISKAAYGNARYYDQIAQANPKIDPKRLRPGTVINLPDAAEVKSSTKTEPKKTPAGSADSGQAKPAAPSTPGVDGQKEYRVAAGDSLYKISVHLYGSGEEVDHLYAINKDAIGPDKSRLKLGMVLKIPAPPTVASAAH